MTNFQKEQECFKKEIEENYISLFDLIHKIQKEQNTTLSQAAHFLLTRINLLLKQSKKQICYKLPTPPFTDYSFPKIAHNDLIKMTAFIHNNGKFRSIPKAQQCGILRQKARQLENIAPVTKVKQHKSNINNADIKQSKQYNVTERETHLQMIAILAEELAKAKGARYIKSNGMLNHSSISILLEKRAQEIEIEALSARNIDTYRKRLREIAKYYKGD